MIQSQLSEEYDDIAFLFISSEDSILDDSLLMVQNCLAELFASMRPFIIIDLMNVESLPGRILGEIMEWRSRYCRERSGDICFAGGGASLEKQIEELRGDRVFCFFPDVASAVNYLYWEYKGNSESILVTIPSDLHLVPATRKFIQNMVLLRGYSVRTAFQIEAIVDELCNNAIEHGMKDTDGMIDIVLAIGREQVEINISNGALQMGEGADSARKIARTMERYVNTPSSSDALTRGRGLALVRMMSNQFEIDSSEDGTCVHVTKYKEG